MHKIMRKALFGTISAFALVAGILGSGINAKAADLAINKTNFPDTQFRSYIEEKIDKDENQVLSEEEIAATTDIDLENITVMDLTGLKYFTNLKSFATNSKRLKTADFSGMNSLESLDIANSTLTSVDITDCDNLKKVTAINFGQSEFGTLKEIVGAQSCDKLEVLDVGWQGFETLDLSGCKALKVLFCCENKLDSLDVSDCTSLTSISCEKNQLTSLKVSGCSKLEELRCYNNELSSLDVSGLGSLKTLECDDNELSSLDVSGCSSLTILQCKNNELGSLDVSGCNKLYWLECWNNKLSSLDVSGFGNLYTLDCKNNKLSKLNVSGCSSLTYLFCYNNELEELNVQDLGELWSLQCYNNQLTKLDVSKNANLKRLDCTYNQLPFLDLEKNKNIGLYLTKVDKQNPYQVSFSEPIKISGLDVNRISDLTGASVQDGKIVPNSGSLEITYVYDNKNSWVKNVKYTLVSDAHEHVYGEEWKTTKTFHYKECSICGNNGQIGAHDLEDVVKEARVYKKNGKYVSKAGSIKHQCSVCEKVVSKDVIPVVSVTGTKFKYSKVRYTGKRRNPEYWVRYGAGAFDQNISPEYYTMKKAKGRLEVGKYTYTLTFKGNYKGTMKLSYKIVPDNTQITKLKATEGGFEVSWEEQPTETTGYRIEYRKGSGKWQVEDIDDNTVTKKKIVGLSRGKQYQVRVRTYKKVHDQIYTSNVSKVRLVVTK